MPSFSTKEMKVAVYRSDDEIERLPDSCVNKLKDLFGWLLPKKEDVLVVLAFAGHYLHKDDAKEIKSLLDQMEVKIVSQTESVMVLKTKKGSTVTIQFVGGSAWFIDSNRRDSESSFEDAADWRLTQELAGVALDDEEFDEDD